jgi:hypothetical protein
MAEDWLDPWVHDGFERRRKARHALGLPVRVALETGEMLDMSLVDVSAGGCSLLPAVDASVLPGVTFVLGFRDADGAACTASGVFSRQARSGAWAATFERRNEAFARWLDGLGHAVPWVA